jgi:ribosomal-protein-alanine N-acetyltransferase
MKNFTLETDRMILRRWRPEDIKPFSKITADPKVMEFFPSTLSETETEALIKTMEEKFDSNGFCFWATELKATQELIGFVGLNIPGYETPFTPCVEIGWRLGYSHWGQGYAPEAAKASLEFGFKKLGLREIVSFTAEKNFRSRRVMEKIGMRYCPEDDFDHPNVPEKHPLRKHVLYRLLRAMPL